MILVDTAVWVDHFRKPEDELMRLLDDEHVLSHPFVTGELAMGRFKDRESILLMIQDQPPTCIAEDEEVVRFVTQNNLHGLGLSYIDAHLLVAVQLTPGASIWTRDERLKKAAASLGISALQLR